MNQLDNTQQLLDNKIDSILHHLDDANGHSILYLFRCEDDISVSLLSQLLRDKNIESRLMSSYSHFIEMELWYKDKSHTKDKYDEHLESILGTFNI